MFALRFYNMFIRKDGLMTDNKSSALLFNTTNEAREYVTDWRVTSAVHNKENADVEVVEVETKQVISKVGKVVELL